MRSGLEELFKLSRSLGIDVHVSGRRSGLILGVTCADAARLVLSFWRNFYALNLALNRRILYRN